MQAINACNSRCFWTGRYFCVGALRCKGFFVLPLLSDEAGEGEDSCCRWRNAASSYAAAIANRGYQRTVLLLWRRCGQEKDAHKRGRGRERKKRREGTMQYIGVRGLCVCGWSAPMRPRTVAFFFFLPFFPDLDQTPASNDDLAQCATKPDRSKHIRDPGRG